MGKIKQYWLITGVLILAILGAGYFFGVKPQAAKVKSVQATTATQVNVNRDLQQEIQRLQKQADGVVAQQNRLRQIAGIIPNNPGLPKLVRSLSAVTEATGVSLLSLSPGVATAVADAVPAAARVAPVEGSKSAAPPKASTSQAPAAAPAPGLASMQITLTLIGDFTTLQLFLAKIEKFDRAFVVDTVSVTPAATASPTGKKSATNPLAVGVTGRVFVNTGVAAAPAPAKAPTATATEK